ncbi:MAG TPA: hypothetical protein VK670_00680 [Silvibacterium sp.]|nr:hypothetical protein [Silvibacterium sp.]
MTTQQQGSQHGQGSQKDNPGTGQHGTQQPQHQQQQDPQKSGQHGQHGSTSGQQGGGSKPHQSESGNR